MLEPMLETVLLAAGGILAYNALRRGGARQRFRPALVEAADRLGGTLHQNGMRDPELRAQIGARRVQLQLRHLDQPRDRGLSVAEAGLGAAAGSLRIYAGWDIHSLPPDLSYIPEQRTVRVPALSGELTVRADDPNLADRFLGHAALDLIDLRREATGHAIEVLARGGTLKTAVHGILPSPTLFERQVRITARLADYLARAVEGHEVAPIAGSPERVRVPESGPAEPAPEALACALCAGTRLAGERWLRCRRCGAAYHRDCFIQATGCIADGCDEVQADPA